MSTSKYSANWENDEVKVDVPYSVAGVSTTAFITSKFTGKMLLFDIGDGAVRDLLASGNLDFINEIDLIAVSHGHFDHMGGLWTMLGFMMMLKRSSALNIIIPNGCSEVISIVKGFKETYFDTLPFQITVHQMQHGSGFDTDFFKLKAQGVEHYGMENRSDGDILMPALGYQVKIGETLVAYTGDSRMCPSLEFLVKDADLAIIEATHEKHPKPERRVHLTVDEAKKLGTKAKEFILVHMKHFTAKSVVSGL
ncbi:MAG: MBL fold metallo-hydrolase [Candidatus Thorarchaeota archaeon]